MPTNKYFNNIDAKTEQDLFSSLITEAFQIHGIDVHYIKRDIPELDTFLREPKFSEFKDIVVVEMYAPDAGANGHGDHIMSKFGYQLQDSIEFFVSIKRWEELNYDLLRPREGDLIYVGNARTMYNTFINTAYEIKSVQMGFPQTYQFGNNHVYRLSCETYSPSYDTFKTGDKNIDSFLNDNRDETFINDVIEQKQQEILVPTGNPFGEL